MAANDTKQSTWRQDTLVIPPQVVQEYVFIDTKPNHVLLSNLGAGAVYMGITLIPSPTTSDMSVAPFSENLYAQDTGFTRIQLLNDGTDPQRVKITSFDHPFNPTTIKPNAAAAPAAEGGGGGGATTISGFSVPLPSGNNNIGKVTVTSMPDQVFTLATLAAGTNNIGKVNVNLLPPLVEGVSHIGSVGIDGGVTITSMPPVTLSNEPIRQQHHYFESVVGVTEVVFDLLTSDVLTIEFISNDDPDNDLFISFDDTAATAAPTNGLNGIIRLRPNEVMNEVNRKCKKIRCIRSAAGAAVRILGV